jgi:hypothetical protein
MGSAWRGYAAAAVMILASSAAVAQDYSSRVREQCSPDARRLCPNQTLGTAEMQYCLQAHFKNISRDCVMALEDDGIVPRGTHQQHATRRR